MYQHLLSTILYGVTSVILGYVCFSYYFGMQSLQWRGVKGKILKSSVRKERNTGLSVYAPSIRYTYTIGDKMYISNRISFGFVSWVTFFDQGHKRARSIVDEYPKGSTPIIYYDPGLKFLSVLKKGVHKENAYIMWIGITLGILSTVIFFLGA